MEGCAAAAAAVEEELFWIRVFPFVEEVSSVVYSALELAMFALVMLKLF